MIQYFDKIGIIDFTIKENKNGYYIHFRKKQRMGSR